MAAADGTIEATLRVLYTINTSPQYILAKSLDKHKVIPVKYGTTSTPGGLPTYGRVDLKPCVTAICRSSPEVQPSGMRDYSLYVLDPLEDIMSRTARGSSDGVAVGMGLLSSILSAQGDTAATVTGTVIQCPSDEVALEVVISLRQIMTTRPDQPTYPGMPNFYGGDMSYNSHDVYMRQMGMFNPSMMTSDPSNLANPMAHMMYPYALAPTKQASKSKASILDHTRAAQFPTPYIGPPKRAPGRPPRKRQEDNNLNLEPTPTPVITPTSTPLVAPTSSQSEGGATPNETSTDKDISMSESECTSGAAPSSASTPEGTIPDGSSLEQVFTALKSIATTNECADPAAELQKNPALLQLLTKIFQEASETGTQETTASVKPQDTDDTEVVCTGTSKTLPQVDMSVENKENVRPQAQTPINTLSHAMPMDEKRRLIGSSGTRRSSSSFMSSSPRQSRSVSSTSSTGSRISVKRPNKDADALEHLRSIKKRRMEQAQNGSSSKSLIAPASSPTPTPGHNVNSGWGGLRMRADGSFSGGHPSRPTMAVQSATSKTASFFRSASTDTNAIKRQGPYVIPQWARGVPPPSPPPRPMVPKNGKEKVKKKRATTSRRDMEPQSQKSDVSMASSDPTQPDEEPEKPELVPPPPAKATVGTPFIAHADAPPIIAHSSPIARPRRSGPSFLTSPCRPSNNANVVAAPQTPSGRSLFGSPASVKSIRHESSLFTPSPNVKTPSAGSYAANVRVRLAPSSPSPAGRRRITINSSTDFGRPLSLTIKGVEKNTYQDESDGPINTLPIASDDDSMAENDEDLTISKFTFSLMKGGKKDWDSLELPPSSPLPASSPSLSPGDLADESGCDSISSAPTSSQTSVNNTPSDTGSQLADDFDGTLSDSSQLFDMTPSTADQSANGDECNDDFLKWQMQQSLMSFDINEFIQSCGVSLTTTATMETFGIHDFDSVGAVPQFNMTGTPNLQAYTDMSFNELLERDI